jgi:hypothetical protein
MKPISTPLTCIRRYLCLLDYLEGLQPLTLRPIIRFISSVSSRRGAILLLPLVNNELLLFVALGSEFSDGAPLFLVDLQLNWLIESGKVHRVIYCIIDGSIGFLNSAIKECLMIWKNLPLIDTVNVRWIHSLKIIGANWRSTILIPLDQLFIKGCPKQN